MYINGTSTIGESLYIELDPLRDVSLAKFAGETASSSTFIKEDEDGFEVWILGFKSRTLVLYLYFMNFGEVAPENSYFKES